MTRSTRWIPLFLLLTFACAIADEAATVPSAAALSKQLYAHSILERSYQSDVATSFAKVMKKFDILAGFDGCPATFDVENNYRAELNSMVESLIGRQPFFAAIEQQLESLNERQRRAAMAVMQSPNFLSTPNARFTWLDPLDNNYAWREIAPEYTVDEKVAFLLASKHSSEILAGKANESIRARGPKLYDQYNQQMIAALDYCIAEEKARLRR